MRVYVHGSMLFEECAAQLVAATVTAVRDDSVDLLLDDGTRLLDWRAKMYDQNEHEIPLERVKRDFMSTDLAALRARVEKLEAIMTNA